MGSGYVGDRLVRVDNIATLDSARGRGYGLAITAAAAAVDPSKPATLIASDLGRGVYERLGFVAMLRFTYWIGSADPEPSSRAAQTPKLGGAHDRDRDGIAVEYDLGGFLASRHEQRELARRAGQRSRPHRRSSRPARDHRGCAASTPHPSPPSSTGARRSRASARGSRPSRRRCTRGTSPDARRTSSWWMKFSFTFAVASGPVRCIHGGPVRSIATSGS